MRGARVYDRGARGAQQQPRRRTDPAARRAALVTSRSSRATRRASVRLSFRTHPKSTIRIYRRSLQWAMYGAVPARTQPQAAIRVRPPFRVVWSRGLGTLIEFPAVVADGVAYIANARGNDPRPVDARRHRDLAARHAAREDGVLARGLGRRARRARDGRPRLGAPPLRRPPPLALHRRLADRILAGRDRRRRRLRRLERDDHGARPANAPRAVARSPGCKITSSAAVAGATLYLGDYCGRLFALRASDGRSAGRARSTVGSTARPRSRRDACSSRARPAAR